MAADQATETTTLYEGRGYELRRLGEGHHDDYSLRHGGLYVEFTDVQRADMVYLLHSRDSGGYMSVRHSTGEEGDVPEHLAVLLSVIRDGADPAEVDL